MVFAHDTEEALGAAADLVNTAQEPDQLSTIGELDAFYQDTGWKGQHAYDEAELAAVRALRPILRRMWLCSGEEQVELVNTLLREGNAMPQVVRHDEFDWHLHATTPEEPLATRMSVEAAMALVDVIRMNETERLKVCDAENCDCIYADLSRNRSRRYCSTACSNRMAAAAYRTRQSESDDTELEAADAENAEKAGPQEADR
ncbi:MAG: CGNR zinc finger domain-containing protein [Ornithinimicrobium sp.]